MPTPSVAAENTPKYYGGRGPMLIIVCWVFFPIATLLVALRIYIQFAMVKARGIFPLIFACVAWV